MEIGIIGSCLDLEISVVFELPTFILYTIDVKELPGLLNLLYGELELVLP